MIGQVFIPITEFVIPAEIPSVEANPETEMETVIVEAQIRKCST